MYDPKEARKARKIARIRTKTIAWLEVLNARLYGALENQKRRKITGYYKPRKLSKTRKELSVIARVFYTIRESDTPVSPLEITHILSAEPVEPKPTNKAVNNALAYLMKRGVIQRVGFAAYTTHGEKVPAWSQRIALVYGNKL